MQFVEAGCRRCALLGDPYSSRWLIQMANEQDLALMEDEFKQLQALARDSSFLLAAVPVASWQQDLSPWEAPPAFGKEPFGQGGGVTLDQLLSGVLPQLETNFGASEARRFFLGGYSLAGLFALWAGYQTEKFSGIAAVSPSVWFPGWIEYAGTHRPKARAFYLSLGDREEKAKNPVMARVGQCIREQDRLFKDQSVQSILAWNPGNHFVDSALRTAKGFAWLLNEP